MPWDKRTLALPATPSSVAMARRWVCDVLLELGRAELVQSAQLGVSELVTNAILHARPPVTVKVRGTVAHPRIEVTDQSLLPPRQRLPTKQREEYLATFGRGLGLVASHADRWGSEVNFNRSGKTVWFEPSEKIHRPEDAGGARFEPADTPAGDADDLIAPDTLITVRLLGIPVELFIALRNHFYEMEREVRLLVLAHPDRYPAAVALADTLRQLEHERRLAGGVDELDKALASGKAQVDLDYAVVASSPATLTRLGELLEAFNEDLRDDVLLATRPPRAIVDLQRWYTRQFVQQAVGGPPEGWDGPITLAEALA